MFMINRRLLLSGAVIWVAATLALRVGGQYVLPSPRAAAVLPLFAISFASMAVLSRRLCRESRLPRAAWPAGAVSLALPTLVLDPFSSAFFPLVFPNMSPAVAGAFGGWMLCCCAGACAGVMIGAREDASESARR